MNNRAINKRLVLCTLAALLLAGCATPKINTGQLDRPKKVAISDIPDIRTAATIQIVIVNWPQYYFSGAFDRFFISPDAGGPMVNPAFTADIANQVVTNHIATSPMPVSMGNAALMGGVAGLTAGILDASAASTEKKAQEFPKLVGSAVDTDLRSALMKSLTRELNAKGIEVEVLPDTRGTPPRMRWAAKNEEGEVLSTGQFAEGPSLDADLLVNLSPVAVYAAPGPLNSYTQRVGIGLALFDARTRKFIGWQAFPYKSPTSQFDYMTYDGLASDVKAAGPALHEALLSLVPQIAGTISGQP